MKIRLRGHHLLCLLGYRGMGYSEAYAANMTRVHERLRTEPDTSVMLVEGPDDLCVCFPADQPYHCDNGRVFSKDAFVLETLGLKTGETRTWADIAKRLAERVTPGDIPNMCAACPWLHYGVCEEGVAILRDGGGLRTLQVADLKKSLELS